MNFKTLYTKIHDIFRYYYYRKQRKQEYFNFTFEKCPRNQRNVCEIENIADEM